MDKRLYFKAALAHGLSKKRAWVNSAFSVIVAESSQTPYPYALRRTEASYEYYLDGDWHVLPDTDPQQPLFRFREAVVVHPGDIANHPRGEALSTTYGNWLVNHLLLALPFGDRIPFQVGHVDIGKIEKIIVERLTDDPEDETVQPEPHQIFVREYLQFCQHALSLVTYAPMTVISLTPKAMTGHPKAREVRAQLEEQYKDQLTDPSIVARIGKQLEDLDREWLKDDPSMDFYSIKAGKYFGAVRKKLYYMFGAESPFQDGTQVEYVRNSLEEGIDPENLPVLINSLRYGSFNRGAQTQLGGESTKTIYRMMGTVRIAEEDCGVSFGIPTLITETNKTQYLGFWIIERGQNILLSADNIDRYVGKRPELRGPLTCKTAGKNVCSKCIGEALAEQPNGLPAAAANLGGRFLSLFLSKMHGTVLATHKWEPNKRIS